MSPILFTVQEYIAQITVNRPAVRNALDAQARREFAQAVEQAHHCPKLRALILTGAGEAFISGGDLRELQHANRPQDGRDLTEPMRRVLDKLEALPFPTIAAVNGAARGGGAETSLACDLRVFSKNATIGFVQSRLGLTTGWGGTGRLVHMLGYARALDLLATGRILSAEEAYRIGLVDRLAEDALGASWSLARQIAANSPEAVQAVKQLARTARLHGAAEAQSEESRLFPELWASEHRRQAMQNFLNKKK